MNQKIVQHDDDSKGILQATAKAVNDEDFKSGRVQEVLSTMKKALASRDDGVALAAPQIGEALRMFIVSHTIFDPENKGKKDLVFINPQITNRSSETEEMEEGCLSVAGLYGKVRRSTHVTMKAQDENGKYTTLEASGLLAQIFQHECDHLNGVLFIDKTDNLYKPSHEK